MYKEILNKVKDDIDERLDRMSDNMIRNEILTGYNLPFESLLCVNMGYITALKIIRGYMDMLEEEIYEEWKREREERSK